MEQILVTIEYDDSRFSFRMGESDLDDLINACQEKGREETAKRLSAAKTVLFNEDVVVEHK